MKIEWSGPARYAAYLRGRRCRNGASVAAGDEVVFVQKNPWLTRLWWLRAAAVGAARLLRAKSFCEAEEPLSRRTFRLRIRGGTGTLRVTFAAGKEAADAAALPGRADLPAGRAISFDSEQAELLEARKEDVSATVRRRIGLINTCLRFAFFALAVLVCAALLAFSLSADLQGLYIR